VRPADAAAGDTVLLNGKFGPEQGEKKIFFNGPGHYYLEPVSWSGTVVRIRIPAAARPGKYVVGIYCSMPEKGGTYSSGSMPLTVKDRNAAAPAGKARAPGRRSADLKNWLGMLAGIIAVIVFLRRFSEHRIELPQGGSAWDQSGAGPDAGDGGSGVYMLEQPVTGEVDGTAFTADITQS